jgi:hypothetical protein
MSEALRGLTSIAPFHPPADSAHPSRPVDIPKELIPQIPLSSKLWWAALGIYPEMLRRILTKGEAASPSDVTRLPGQGVSPSTPTWPLPAEDEAANPSELITRLWSNLSRRGNTGRGTRKREEEEEDACAERASAEIARCYKRAPDMAHPDYLDGCIKRAKTRADMCKRNGGKPRRDEPPEWKDPDEETWLNHHR